MGTRTHTRIYVNAPLGVVPKIELFGIVRIFSGLGDDSQPTGVGLVSIY